MGVSHAWQAETALRKATLQAITPHSLHVGSHMRHLFGQSEGMCWTSRVCLQEEYEAVLARSGFPGALQVPGAERSVVGGLEN